MGEMIGIHQQAGTVRAYMAAPQKREHFSGAVIIVHELWGLGEHIRTVADRFANQGYFALAPDLYSGKGDEHSPSDQLQRDLFSSDSRIRYEAQPKLRALIAPTQTPQFTSLAISRLESCFEYIYNQPLVHQKVSVVGYGLGGNYAISLAIREPRLRCAVAYYGQAKYPSAELQHIKCPILGFYGSRDKSLALQLNHISENMQKAGVDFHPVLYENAGHAFFNDTNPYSYNEDAASDSWTRTQNFLQEHMA